MKTNGEAGQPRETPKQLANLLVQCAVQAQLSYYNEFKNEIKTRWLEAFLGHEHLRVERTGAQGSGKVLYRGLSNGLRCSWNDYLSTMLSGKAEKYEVRYKVGTPDYAGSAQPSSSASEAARGGAQTGGTQPAWAAASASRAANPYLNKPEAETYREYTELVEPSRIAHGLMSISNQLCREWHYDLTRHVAREGSYLLQCSAEGGAADECDVDAAPMSLMAEVSNLTALVYDSKQALPGVLYASLRAASAAWNTDFDFDEAPSPFRAENFDLLQRAVTREAALSALADLQAAGHDDASARASALWLRERLEGYAAYWEKPPRNQLAGLFVLELLTAPPSPRTLPADEPPGAPSGLGMTDPERVVELVLVHRQQICNEWGTSLRDDLPPRLQQLLADSLNRALLGDVAGEGGADEDEDE